MRRLDVVEERIFGLRGGDCEEEGEGEGEGREEGSEKKREHGPGGGGVLLIVIGCESMKVKLSGGKLDFMGGCGWSFFIYHSRRGHNIHKGTYFQVSL